MMNLLRNVHELNKTSRLLKSLKRAEEYLFSFREIDSSNNSDNGSNQKSSSSSIPSFKTLFQEEAQILPSYLSKLNVASHHPVMGIAREFYGQNPCMPSILPSLQLRAMCVLLIAKSVRTTSSNDTNESDYQQLIESKQRDLSQITELLFAAHMLHRSVVNLDSATHSQLHQGNKLATLMGDLLMAKTSRRLSQLKNHRVTEVMSNTIAEFSSSGFIGEGFTPVANDQSISKRRKLVSTIIKQPPQLSYQNWLERSKQSLGSIIGNSCLSCMILAGQEDSLKLFVSDLGRLVGVFLQTYRDLTMFESEDGHKLEPHEFHDLWTLPVIFEAEQNPNIIPSNNISQINYIKVFETIQSNEIGVQNSKKVLLNYKNQILNILNELKPSESKSILIEIINSMIPKNSQYVN